MSLPLPLPPLLLRPRPHRPHRVFLVSPSQLNSNSTHRNRTLSLPEEGVAPLIRSSLITLSTPFGFPWFGVFLIMFITYSPLIPQRHTHAHIRKHAHTHTHAYSLPNTPTHAHSSRSLRLTSFLISQDWIASPPRCLDLSPSPSSSPLYPTLRSRFISPSSSSSSSSFLCFVRTAGVSSRFFRFRFRFSVMDGFVYLFFCFVLDWSFVWFSFSFSFFRSPFHSARGGRHLGHHMLFVLFCTYSLPPSHLSFSPTQTGFAVYIPYLIRSLLLPSLLTSFSSDLILSLIADTQNTPSTPYHITPHPPSLPPRVRDISSHPTLPYLTQTLPHPLLHSLMLKLEPPRIRS